MSTEKFRPYFSAAELTAVISALKFQAVPANRNLIRYLETFAIKIERGVVVPASTLAPTIEQKLGFAPAENNSIPEESLPALCTSYEMFPAERIRFSPRQLEAIQSYRFANDRMTEKEEREYVQSLPKTTT